MVGPVIGSASCSTFMLKPVVKVSGSTTRSVSPFSSSRRRWRRRKFSSLSSQAMSVCIRVMRMEDRVSFSDISDGEVFGVFTFEVLEIELYLAHVFFDVTRWDDGTGTRDGLRRIVYSEEHDGDLCLQGNVIESFFHSGLALRVPSGVMARLN